MTAKVARVPMYLHELMVWTICGGCDGTSGISANPAVGRCFTTAELFAGALNRFAYSMAKVITSGVLVR